MKHRFAFAAVILALAACATTKGSNPAEKRKYALEMHDQTLADLYEKRPELKVVIENAPGYATFSNIGAHFILVGGGGGFGVAHNNETGADTFMRMAEVGVGLGLRLSDFRAVFVFHEPKVFEKFVTSGWEFGGEVGAAAVSDDKGGVVEGAGTTTRRMDVYQITKSGIAVAASLSGTKFWRDKDLQPKPSE